MLQETTSGSLIQVVLYRRLQESWKRHAKLSLMVYEV